jgi:hypothetical protein
MIAPANISKIDGQARRAAQCSATDRDQEPGWQDRFLRMLPDITRHARVRLRSVAPAVREEALDEVLAHALVGYHRLVELDKEALAYATPLAGYAVAQFRAGRRVGLRRNVHDVLSDACRRRHGLTIERVDRFDRSSGEWQEALVEDRRFGPADAAATRLDFAAWLKSLTKRNRQLAEKLASGESTGTVARLFRISRARVSQLRRELSSAWKAFHGETAPAHG